MGFINRIKRNLDGAQEFDVPLLGELFRRYIEQLGAPGGDVALHLVDGSLGERRVDEVGHAIVVARLAHGIHLIFHQGDEWRNHDGHSFHQKRWELVAQRFAASGGHQDKHVLAIKQGADDGLLVVFEGLKTEVFL